MPRTRRNRPTALFQDRLLLEPEGDVLACERRHGAKRLMVALDLGEHWQLPEAAGLSERLPGALVHRRRAALVGDRAVLLQAEGGFLKVD